MATLFCHSYFVIFVIVLFYDSFYIWSLFGLPLSAFHSIGLSIVGSYSQIVSHFVVSAFVSNRRVSYCQPWPMSMYTHCSRFRCKCIGFRNEKKIELKSMSHECRCFRKCTGFSSNTRKIEKPVDRLNNDAAPVPSCRIQRFICVPTCYRF